MTITDVIKKHNNPNPNPIKLLLFKNILKTNGEKTIITIIAELIIYEERYIAIFYNNN